MSGSYLFLVHPVAGSGRGRRRLERLLARNPELSRRSRVCVASSPSDVLEHLRGRAAAAVAVGGDGTANMVAAALVREGAHRPMGVLPFGTGNAFAHSLGLGSTRAAVRALRAGTIQSVDVLRTDHPHVPVALVSISCGFEARHIQRYAKLRGWTRPLAAVLACMSAMPRSTRGVSFTVDGHALIAAGTAVYNAGVYNHRCYMGGWTVWPDADPGDGAAEAVVFRTGRTYAGALLKGLRTASPASPDGDPAWTRCSRAVLESAEPFQIDGEAVACSRISIEVHRGALHVLVPGPVPVQSAPVPQPAV